MFRIRKSTEHSSVYVLFSKPTVCLQFCSDTASPQIARLHSSTSAQSKTNARLARTPNSQSSFGPFQSSPLSNINPRTPIRTGNGILDTTRATTNPSSTASLFAPRTSAQSPFPPPLSQRSKQHNKNFPSITFPQILNSTKSYPIDPSHPAQILFRLGGPKDSAANPLVTPMTSRGPNGAPISSGEYRQVFKDMVMQAQVNRHSFSLHQKVERFDREARNSTKLVDPNSSEFFNKLHSILAETRITTTAQALASQAWQNRKNTQLTGTIPEISASTPLDASESDQIDQNTPQLESLLQKMGDSNKTNTPGSTSAFAFDELQHRSSRRAPSLTMGSSSLFTAYNTDKAAEPNEDILIPKRLTASKFAKRINVRTNEVLRCLATITQRTYKPSEFIDFAICEEVALEFGKTLKAEENKIPLRAPIVSVMGHVDAGKTTLLDCLRNDHRAELESGGITQSIGGFSVNLYSSEISNESSDYTQAATFIDTPGHAAFRSMRQKGANRSCTDIIVLVVHSVDGVKPQTVEVIKLAQEENIPLVVAISCCDLPNSNPQRVLQQLLMYEVVTEADGGDVLAVEISAKTGKGIDQLKDAISLCADMQELRAPTDGVVKAFILESRITRANGNELNVVVRSGCLRVGDHCVAGVQSFVVRQLINERGNEVDAAYPSQAIQVLGIPTFEGITDELITVENAEVAESLVRERTSTLVKETMESEKSHIESLPVEIPYKIRLSKKKTRVAIRPLTDEQKLEAEYKEQHCIRLILRADVRGSLEALTQYVERLPRDEIDIIVMKAGLGNIIDSDVDEAHASKAVVIGFNVSITSTAALIAKTKEVRTFANPIIYRCMDVIQEFASEVLPAKFEDKVVGTAVVRDIFPFSKKKSTDPDKFAAGIYVNDGFITITNRIRIHRAGEIIHEGSLASLRHVQKKISTAESGKEYGLVMKEFHEWEVTDKLECIATHKVQRLISDEYARGFENLPDFEASPEQKRKRVRYTGPLTVTEEYGNRPDRLPHMM